MAKLLIWGHATRGQEVIEILKMLGGKNDYHCLGNSLNDVYGINEIGVIELYKPFPSLNTVIFTIENFLKKYPYKVGDKVQPKGAKSYDLTYVIEYMTWANNRIEYEIRPSYDLNHTTGLVPLYVEDLKPYKEENMERKIESFEILESHCADEVKIEFDPSKYEIVERKNGYYVVKKQPKYPKTYEECAKELGYNQVMPKDHILGYMGTLLSTFQQLLICRDAYWKIAGDWKPDRSEGSHKYCLINCDDEITKCAFTSANAILTFPTKEMRDAFYEKFKELIESCKELL